MPRYSYWHEEKVRGGQKASAEGSFRIARTGGNERTQNDDRKGRNLRCAGNMCWEGCLENKRVTEARCAGKHAFGGLNENKASAPAGPRP